MKPDRDIPLLYDGVRVGTVIDVSHHGEGLLVDALLEQGMRGLAVDEIRRQLGGRMQIFFDDRPLLRPE